MTSCSQKFKNVPVCLPAVMGNRKSSHFRKLLIFLTLKKKKINKLQQFTINFLSSD